MYLYTLHIYIHIIHAHIVHIQCIYVSCTYTLLTYMCTYRVLLFLCHRQDQCHLPALKTTSSLSLFHLFPLFWVGSPLHRFSLTPIRVGGTGSRTPTVLPQRPHSPFPSIPCSILVSDTVSLREPAQLKLQTASEVDTETTFLLKTAAAQRPALHSACQGFSSTFLKE